MWTLSDESLLEGLASGHPEAAAAFVRRFQSRVFGLALTIVGDREAAEDVAQETFVRAWRHAAAYDARRARVATWLLAIARNVAIDVIRLKRADPVDPSTIAALPLVAVEEGPDERAMDIYDVGRLATVMRELPEEQRRALLLASFRGLTAQEISEAEGIPLGTAKTRIRTAMLKVRAALEVSGEG